MEDRSKKYLELWEKDSQEIEESKTYEWIIKQIEKSPKEYKNIMEIGCGAGISTLNLLKKGYNVSCIVDSNENCIKKTRKLLHDNNYNNIKYIKKIVLEENIESLLVEISNNFDLILCWNPGGAGQFGTETLRGIIKEIGFKEERHLHDNLEENKKEFLYQYKMNIIRATLKLGKKLNADVQIVDRQVDNDIVISEYQSEFNYKKLELSERLGKSNKNIMEIETEIKYKSYMFIQ